MRICALFADHRVQLSRNGTRYVLTIVAPEGPYRMAFNFDALEKAIEEAHAWMAFFEDEAECMNTAGELELLTSDAFMQEALMRFVTQKHNQVSDAALSGRENVQV